MAGEAKGLVVTSQHQGDAFTITTFVRPRRNGGPNLGCYAAVMSLLATINPDAYDPDEAPSAQPAARAEPMPHDMAAALERDLRAGRVLLDDTEPYPTGVCASGACPGD